ncbi:type I polyketide synthase [Micromonospora sp. WMMA1363]|uniref:type I polyketide synthase n=1 Tax=Micromonospora sp. WMMA1363 TaxID=3053985 RepID=UPI00259C8AED|nr:type I polyketide synthase [Micromonospora sp. WMMA1363]MDM4723013.1 type I polyketide synthase [Micromonospora sp. WMMA1363]
MSAPDEQIVQALRASLKENARLQQENDAFAAAAAEPIAIVSMACRYAGGIRSPEDLWRVVTDGTDVYTGFPTNRGWDLEGLYHPDPDNPGTTYVREGAFLHDAGQFDAAFFGISPREALAMDPQQRQLLEVAWETFERAGVDPHSVRGGDVGVFAGIVHQDYAPDLSGHEGFLSLERALGTAGGVASGRVAYTLGLEGPAVTVDTMCSSSLVAVHLAAQALRRGECSMALAGGSTVMATPGGFVGFARQRGLAFDGRCKSYAAGADGSSWAEGVGVLLLERLSVARERGHRVLAVIRGSAVNQDGASNGLTAPNGPSQQRVIRKALASAGLDPSEVDTVEGHGTGTVLGDPIEAQALIATYGQGRDPQHPLWLGSVKSVIGHTQAASGVAGVIKTVLALRHRLLPATRHVDAPTPQVDWSAGAVELLTEARDWPRDGRPRRAGVSSFGASGTNAHLILEEAPEDETAPAESTPTGVVPLVVSANTAASLAAQAVRLASFVEGAEVPLAQLAGALVSGRATLAERAVVVAGSVGEATTGFAALAAGGTAPGLVTGSGAPGKVVWVFPGQGTQWVGMGRELLDSSVVFAERIAECAAELERWVDWSLVDVLRGDADPALMKRVDVLQPASFAVMVGLAAVWASVGVQPDAVVGHSQGEIAAACVAGALPLRDAARVVALRSQAIAATLSGRGGMASVALGESEVTERLTPWADRVEVAAVNGPSSVVIAGDADALDDALDLLDDQGVRVRRVAVDYASHTRHVEDLRDTLADALAGIGARAPEVPFYSTVTGGWIQGAGVVDSGYWYRNLRGQVRFGPAVADLIAQGHGVFVEISAHPVLVQPISEIVDRVGSDVVVTGSLRRDEGGPRRLLTSMAELFVRGVALDWAAILPSGATSAHVDLPTYAFDHQHYWLRMADSATDAASLGLVGADHPLLGAVLPLPQSDGLVFTSRLSLRTHPWLADHAIGGVVLVPGTVYVDLAVRAGDEFGFGVLEELVIEAPLVLPENGGVRLQVAVGGPGETGSRPVAVYSLREDGADEWTRHAVGLLSTTATPATGFDFTVWPPQGVRQVDIEGFYTDLVERGYAYGPAFQGLRAVWRRGDEVFAEVALPDDHREDAGTFGIHPALLDAALHTNAFANPDDDRKVLPFAWNGLVLHAVGAAALRVRVAPSGPDALSFQAADDTGALVVTMDSLVSLPVSAEQLETAAEESRDSLFRVEWVELPPATGEEPASPWVPVATAADVAALTRSTSVASTAVLHAVGDDDGPLALTTRVLAVVQAWLTGEGLEDSRLVVVTRGAVPAGDGAVRDPAGAAVWGLLRAAQAENPNRIVLVDTDPAGPDPMLAAALASGEPQLAVRGTTLRAPRLAQAGGQAPDAPAVFRPEGRVLVTGGTGSLGAVLARHLVSRHGVRRLVLAGRRGTAGQGVAELVAELTERGADVSVAACDVSDRESVAALLAEHQPTAIVHLAGVLDDGVIGALTPERLAGVFAPKVDAVRHLDELTRGSELDAFVVFSSAAALMGSAGQGNYAAANAFLDGVMAQRRAAGLPGLSLAWGLWEQATGLTAHLSAVDQARMSRGGVLALTPAEGVTLFDIGLCTDQALLVPIKLDLKALRAQAAAGGDVPHLLRGLVRVGRRVARAAAGDSGGLLRRLAGLAPEEQEKLLIGIVQAEAAGVLGFRGPELTQGTHKFTEIGFDSLTAVELRNRLSAATGVKLPATLIFDYPTPVALAGYLRGELGDTVAGAATTVTVAADLDEPIAIVGMACRLPGGVTDPDDLWRMVFDGRDGMSPFPDDRGWDLDGLFDADPDRPGTSYIRQGGFLAGAGLFDAGFFGISPREALAMDPQQRLLLEASWEALEQAGVDPTSVQGGDVGVFSGVSIHDYLESLSNMPAELEGFVTTATAGSVASGRVSYVFGFEGPAMTVDTACSSSLVATHLAAQALRQGECSMALAGGVAVMGSPVGVLGMSRQRGLAPDGRCKAFSADADGTVLSEGVAVVVLERLSVARERGHQVLAVIRGSAVNQDGASNGLTAPNGPSQQRVIRSALANAGLSASEVDAVEAHGTGTSLGDPIEAQALLATYGRDRDPDHPLWLGSLKSNVGHTQAAAGVASVIKMVQALRHGVLPPTLHVAEPTHQVDWSAGAVELLTEARDWSPNGRPRRVGVSSFGISGTNAHLIIEEAPADDVPAVPAQDVPDGVVPLVVSARSAASLTGQAGRLAAFLSGEAGVPLGRVAGALLSTRAALADRAVVVAGSTAEALAGLDALARGESGAGVVTGSAGGWGGLVWVFPGQGTQWVGMGRELLDSSPVFAERITECAAALQPWVDWSLVDVLRGHADPELTDRVDVLQPASFAVMVGLAAVWSSVGVVPDAVLGHSQGEIAAACVAGALSLEDAARVVALRSQAIATRLSGRGGMASVALGEDEAAARLAPWAGRVEVAAVNGPSSVVIAGDAEALAEAVVALGGRRVAVDYASHTRQVEDIEDTLAETLAGINAQAPAVPFYSTVSGEWIRDAGVVDGGYWYRNLRNQVRFGPAVADLVGQGHGVFVEVSAHPVLVQPITDVVDGIEADGLVTGTLRRDDGGVRRLMTSMAELFVRGVPVDWSGLLPPVTGRVELPTYAFDHRHYWLHTAVATDAPSLGLAGADHPMLGAVVRLPQSDGLVFTSRLSLRSHPWLADHEVGGEVVVPGAGLVELAVRAGDEAGCPVLAELAIETPLVVPAHGGVRVQVALSGPRENGVRAVDVYALREDTSDDGWTRHATGVLSNTPGTQDPFDVTAWPPPGARSVDVEALYADLAGHGFAYGQSFQAVRAAWQRDGEVFVDVALPEDRGGEATAFGVHPALLDAALHPALLDANEDGPQPGQPLDWRGVVLHAVGASALRVRLAPVGADSLALAAVDETGALVVTVDSLRFRAAPTEESAAAGAGTTPVNSLFQVEWTELPDGAGAPAVSWAPVTTAEDVTALTDAPAAVVLDAAGADDALTATARVLEVVRAWLTGSGVEDSRLVVVTRGAVPAGDGTVTEPAAAAVWGLVRAAQGENPDRIILLDLDPTAGEGAESVLGAVLASGEPQVAVRGTTRSVPRLARVARTTDAPAVFDPAGTVLVSGAGALGALVARHLVTRHGVRRLVLASRRGSAAEGMAELVAELSERGADVSVVACDMSERAEVAALLAAHRPSAVVHTAGVLDAGVIETVTPEKLARVFAPKVDAVRHLDELTRDLRLDAFVVYSSVSAVFMGAGSGSYAAANAFLDGLMAHRRSLGLPGLSLAWGLWDQATGMAAGTDELTRARMNRRGGLQLMSQAEGLELFDAALGAEQALLVPAKLDLRVVRADAAAGGAVPHMLRGLVGAGRRQARSGGAGGKRGRLAERLAGLTPADQLSLLLDLVRGQVAAVLGHSGAGAVRADAAFKEAGFDSLTSVELRNRLREATGLKLPATLVFDHPNPQVLARHLRDELGDAVPTTVPPPVLAADPEEPIAVVGMACRLPGGVAGPADLWRLVAERRDAVSGFPTDRGWDLEGLFDPDPERPGTSYTSRGGFLHEAGLFDAAFFGISPREALAMDPQQRLLLETSWEALEATGVDATSLKGSDVGVFTGVFGQGYVAPGADAVTPELEGFAGTGGSSSVASGRVSYVFGFEGPAITIDTACSSSLVAIHLAAQALRRGDCSMALAGGATVMANPGAFVEFSRQRGLAVDGRCKAFAAAADGTGWAEGVGVVVLERLSVARDRGHTVLAVLRGSAVNQDGASNGLTAPNGPSQQRVIRRALADAGLAPSEVDVVEAHGTGTALGDPIEAQALLATYGRDRDPGKPLWLGSLKSNIGHAQAAAGVAGVIKIVQALRHGMLPATLHVDAPTPEVDWSAGAVELLTEARDWPRNGRPRRAGVSAFGVSGTNAHLILEEAPQKAAPDPGQEASPDVLPVLVSARSGTSLAAQAGRLAEYLDGAGDVPLASVAGALVSGRAALSERAVVVAGSRAEATAGLAALARGEHAAGVVTGRAGTPGKVVWVFPGQGTQWAGMGRELLDSSPVFAGRIAECAAALQPWVDWQLIDVLRGEVEPEVLDRVDVLQPASFAMMVGLAAVWRSGGLRPDAVVGHSQGEIAAACVAGALSLQDAARVVALRSRAIATALSGRGGMASVALREDEAVARLAPWADLVQVAAVNSPTSVVVAGDARALDEALGSLAGDGVRVRRVAVDYGSHTSQVEALHDLLAESLADVRAQAPRVPFYSTVTGDWIREAGVVDGGYWYRNLRSQVRFGPAVADLIGQDHGVFVEISAHPVLVQPISEIVDDADVVVTGSVRRDDGGLRRLLTSMAELFVRGVAVDWTSVLPPVTERVELPTYAFEHRHYWLRQPTGTATDATSLGQAAADHPLLGAVVQLPRSDGMVFTSLLSVRSHPWLADHAVGGVVILPGSGLVELAVRAGDEVGCSVLDELLIEAPLVVPERGGVRVQVALSGPGADGVCTVEVYSRRDGGAGAWTRHATGALSATPSGSGTGFDFTAWPPRDAVPVDIEDFYADLAERGYGYGPAFRGLRAVWRRGDEVFAEVALPEDRRAEAGGFGVHPALLDAALQAATAGDTARQPGEAVLAFAWNGLVLHAAGAAALRVRLAPQGPDALAVEAADETGGPVLTMDSLVSRPVSVAHLEAAAHDVRDSVFRVDWAELPASAAQPMSSWAPVDTADEVRALAQGGDLPPVAVVDAAGGDGPLAVTSRVLEVVQAWLAAPRLEEVRLVVRTRGAVPAGGDHLVTDPAAAAVWGLVRSAQAENPDRIVLLDADPATGAGSDLVLAVGEPQLAVRGSALSVPRLARTGGQLQQLPVDFRPDGTVLVSGAGALGGLVARHLVTRYGVRRLVLASRRGRAADGVAELVADLTGQGADVSVVACDLSDRVQVAALLAEHAVTGVVHTAGVFDDGLIGGLTRERLAGVFASKVDAVRHLDELTRGLDLDVFVVFSSVAGVVGGGGQGSYAAANAFLDAAMSHRRAAGLPALSLAWGLWERGIGMATHLSVVDQARASRGGVLELSRAEGLGMFDAALCLDQALLVPLKLDPKAMRADAAAGGAVPSLLRGLVRPGRQPARAAVAAGDSLARSLAGLPPADQEARLLDVVRAQVAVVLGHADPRDVRADTAFKDVGFDSLTSVELRNRLREATGLKLPPTLVFDYPNPLVLAGYLRTRLCPDNAGPGAGADADEARLRQALASVPLARLRAAGLVDALLELAATGEPDGGVGDEPAVADLDVDDLVELVLGGE